MSRCPDCPKRWFEYCTAGTHCPEDHSMTHKDSCGWHQDQYPWECTCGLTDQLLGWGRSPPPEMFAEWRERGFRGDIALLPPGPAFIHVPNCTMTYCGPRSALREAYGVPDGYIWQPATEGTGAGWVRPHGEPDLR